MITPPEVVQTDALETAVIKLKIPRSEIQTVMGPAIGEVIAAVTAQGIGPVGPVFSHHFRMTEDAFDFEVGVPVSAPVTPTGRVEPSTLRATRAAKATYQGGYEGLGEGWGQLSDWIENQGLEQAPDLWEFYAAGPETGSDSSNWRTELIKPLVDR